MTDEDASLVELEQKIERHERVIDALRAENVMLRQRIGILWRGPPEDREAATIYGPVPIGEGR